MSRAHLDESGPFSDFSGYTRFLVLLQGAGMRLRFGSGTQRVLDRIGDMVTFDGGAMTHCDLLAGSCVDMNFMVSMGVSADARVWAAVESHEIEPSGATTLVFAIDKPVQVSSAGQAGVTLDTWDLAVLPPAARHGIHRADDSAGQVFIATLDYPAAANSAA